MVVKKEKNKPFLDSLGT